MVRRRLHVAILACGLVAVYAHAADNDAKGKGREETRANATRKSAGPSSTDAMQPQKRPLQTGEVKVPAGGVDTSQFDPNAGEGFKGRSTSGGGTIQPRGAASGRGNAAATTGAPLSGATAPQAPRDTGRGSVARGERGSGTTETNSGGTRTGGGAGSVGSSSR